MSIKIKSKKWNSSKKKLSLKRKHTRKINKFYVITDTNIWYQLGGDEDLFNNNKNCLRPTYSNLWELSYSGRIVSSPDKVRNAIRKAMLCSHNMIIQEPLKYLTKRANKKFSCEISNLTNDMLQFTQNVANGLYLDEASKKEFHKQLKLGKNDLEQFKLNMIELAKECKSKIENLKKHREKNTLWGIIRFINFMVEQATNKKYNLKKLALKEYELLILAMDCFFKKLETGEIQWQRNDLFDLFNLAYVRKGDKYWTNETRWIQIIKDAGVEQYLFEPNSSFV